ncbi:hypothetical protein [Pseudoalteromonas piscicida]|uniref:hypothetical protein n=1 Tax=Pseudoalteromonas piscicida TaxID=43662 RepID=UPI0032C1A54A
MNLDKFVAETINQIIKGVSASQEYAKSLDATVNPASARVDGNAEGYFYCSKTGVPLQTISFDIAVTVNQEKSSNGDKFTVGSISVSSLSSESSQNTSESRIKFSVPMLLPTQGEKAAW